MARGQGKERGKEEKEDGNQRLGVITHSVWPCSEATMSGEMPSGPIAPSTSKMDSLSKISLQYFY